jgi:hypothetical protein
VTTLRPNTPFYNETIINAKREKRQKERKWRKTRLEIDHQLYIESCTEMNRLFRKAKTDFYSDKIIESQGDQRTLFNIADTLLKRNTSNLLPQHTLLQDLCDDFASFFSNKIKAIREKMPPS